jgi:hypothetical protein
MKDDVTNNFETPWLGPELKLIGVYKRDPADTGDGSPGNPWTLPWLLCVDQNDANTNGRLTVWEYRAIDQKDGTTEIPYDIRGGSIIADPSLPLDVEGNTWDHRAYVVVAPGIPATLGGAVRLFDGYLRPQDQVSEISPQAKPLDPANGPGANAIRVSIYHPAVVSGVRNHILRLLTYRPLTTS